LLGPPIATRSVSQRGQVAPRANERLLHCVLGEVRVVENQSCGRIHAVDRGGRKRGEGVMIALSRPFHELSLHVTLSVVAARRPRS
jgi:hypothetical protein